MISEAVYSHLSTSSAVTDLCSEIHPDVRPLRAGPPFIVYTLDFDQRERLMDGSEASYRKAVIGIDVYATKLADAIDVANAVESVLTDYRGVLGSTSPSVDVDHVRLERRGPHIFESDTSLYRVPLEFLIGHEIG